MPTKETACTSCAHRTVCKHSEEFLAAVKAIDNVSWSVAPFGPAEYGVACLRDSKFVVVEVRCNMFQGKSSVFRGE